MNLLGALLAQNNSSGSPLGLLIILVPFGLLVWLMIVPQRKQRARQQQLLGSLEPGDEVVTAGGIVGVITHLEDQLVHLEVDHDVVIRVAKGSISRSTAEPDPATQKAKGGLLSGLTGGSAKADDAADEDTPARTRAGTKGAAPVSKRVTPKK